MEDSQTTSRETVRVLAALSDENRFRIVELLAGEGELSCGAIGTALDISPSLLSHHLSILTEAGLIGRRKNGLWTMNGLQRPVLARQIDALSSLLGNGHANGNGNGNGHGADPVIATSNGNGASATPTDLKVPAGPAEPPSSPDTPAA